MFLAGRVAVETDRGAIGERRFPGRQGRSFFAYLVAEQGRSVPRDELAEALWGDKLPATWEKALTVIASRLRSLLADSGIDGARALTAAFGCYRLELPAGTWVDVVAARAAAEAAEEAAARGDLVAAKREAAQAASLTRQPFLPGDDGAWVEATRRDLADIRVGAMSVLTDVCLRLGESHDAAQWAEQVLAVEPFHETAYRSLMAAHAAAGNRAEALQVYDRCRRLLAEELGAYPSPETEALYRDLLERPVAQRASAAPVDDERPSTVPLRARGPRLGRRLALAAAVSAAVSVTVALSLPLFTLGGGSSSASTRNVIARVGADTVGVFESSSGRLVGRAAIGAEPGAVAAGAGDVWVASIGNDTVTRVDVKTRTRLQTITVGTSPSAITVADGFVWVANSLGGTISKIDPAADGGGGAVVDTIPVGNGPAGVVVGAGRLWVANSADRTVMEFRLGSRKPVRTFGLPGGADAVAFGFGLVWVVGSAANSVTRIVPGSDTVLPALGVGNDPRAIAVGAGAVWVANSLDGTVSRIDPRDASVEGIAVRGSPAGIAVSSGAVWVADGRAGLLSRIDPAARQVVQTVRIRARAAGVAAAGGALFVAAATAGRSHRGGTLRLSIPGFKFDSIDPAVAYWGPSWSALSMTNDGLVTFQRVGGSDGARLVPDLGTSIPSPTDGRRTYTFQVRRGIRYSTGAAVQPDDFRRAIERSLALWHRSPDGTGFYFTGLRGAAACTKSRCDLSRGIVTDARARTVTFHLVAPDPDFLFKLATSSAYAVPAGAPLKPDAHLPATGPYMVARYRAGRSLLLVRNPRFRVWNPAAQPDGYPDRIAWTFRTDDPRKQLPGVTAAVRDVRESRLDYTDDATRAEARLRRDGFGAQLHLEPRMGTSYFVLNSRVAPFDNVDARRAVNYAIDRALYDRRRPQRPTCQVLPPNLPGYVRYCPYRTDLARARRLVAASGTRGDTVTILAFFAAPASYLRSVLRRLGYRVRLRILKDGPTFLKVKLAGRGWQASHDGWNPDYPSAFDYFHPLLTCPSFRPRAPDYWNDAGFCDPAIDRAIAHAASLQSNDPTAAAALWSTVDRRVVDAAPWVPYGNDQEVDFVSRRVGNYQYNPQFGALLDQMWVR